jgi:hypothetical protein
MGEKPILTVLKAEGHSADTDAGKFPIVSMGGRAEGLACADPGARTPIGASGNASKYHNYKDSTLKGHRGGVSKVVLGF